MRDRIAFSVADAALATGLGRTRLFQAIREGKLIAKKFGRRTVIEAAALHAFVNNLPNSGRTSKKDGA